MLVSVTHELQRHAMLGAGEEDRLRRCWLGHGNQNDHAVVARLIQKLRTDRLWLACACRGSKLHESPLFSPVKSGETYFLRRMSDRSAHIDNCIFKAEQVNLENSDRSGHRAVTVPDWGFDDAVIESSVGSVHRKKSASPTQSTSHLSSLARRMFWLASQCGIQQWTLHDRRSLTQKVLEYAERTIAFEQVSLKQVLFASAKAYNNAWFDRSFDLCRRNGIVEGAWWIMVCQAAQADTKTVNLDGLVLSVTGKLEVFGGDLSPARFPMLAICRVDASIRHGEIAAVYLHPLANHAMLVESNLERNTLEDLCQAVREHKAAREATIITKPLFNMAEGERPDFVVHKDSKRMIVETMGFDNQDYWHRKQALAGAYASDTVFFDWRTKVGATERLKRFTLAWLDRTETPV